MSSATTIDSRPGQNRLASALRAVVRTAFAVLLTPIGAAVVLVGALVAVFDQLRRRPPGPRLLWGTQPIISLVNASRAMARAGYRSETVAIDSSPLYERELFDHTPYLSGRNAAVLYVGNQLRAYLFFATALARYDVFHYFFDGGVLRRTPLTRIELPVLRALGKKIVLLPYGGDAFVYDAIPDPLWRHALMIEYAALGDASGQIQRRVRRAARHADVVVGCVVHVACLPRWDVLPVTAYPIDAHAVEPVAPSLEGPVRVAHSANHRGAKGTDFLVAAIEDLKAEGHDIELDLIERVPNREALARMAAADIYVDQLVFGYAMAALEAMALGKVVISGIDATPEYALFRRYSYLGECPIVPASPETIGHALRELIAARQQWRDIGEASRLYVERWHSYPAAQELYGSIYRRIWAGEDVDLINLYHPLRRRGSQGVH